MFQFVLRGFFVLLKNEFEGWRVSPTPTNQQIHEDVNNNDYQKKYSALIESQVKARNHSTDSMTPFYWW
jgi:hypothetical protein